MDQESQLALALIDRNLTLSQWIKVVEITEKLRERNIPLEETLQCVEAAAELSEPEFRKAAHATLGLMKKTGETPGEVEARIEELSSQIEGKRKEKSEWDEKAKKAKEKTEEWEQKRRNERVEFEREQSLNRDALEKSREELEEELRQHDVVRENVEEFIGHKSQLQSIDLDCQTFDSILREMVQKEGISPDVGGKVKKKIKQVGSLDEVIAEKERRISKLSKEELEKGKSLKQLNDEIEQANGKIEQGGWMIKKQEQAMKDLNEIIGENMDQYDLFRVFLSMLHSVEGSLSSLGERLQRIDKGRRIYSPRLDWQRAIFLLVVMGTHLRSIRCYKCGASFLVNSPTGPGRFSYCCPTCGFDRDTRGDDSFLRVMTSPELSKLIQDAKTILGAGGQGGSN